VTGLAIDDVEITGRGGPLPGRSYRRTGDRGAVGLVWLHGGGFVAGDLDMPEADGVSRALAGSGVPVLSVAYSLSIGGTRFPVPRDDAVDAWRWARDNAASLGMSPATIALGGASAGANLAAGAAMVLRDAGGDAPSALVLVYPMVHYPLLEPDPDLARALVALPPEWHDLAQRIDGFSLAYAGSPDVLADPWVMPGNAPQAGLPPALILDAEIDVLRPSGEAFAADLVRAGGAATVVTEPGTTHGYLNTDGDPAGARSLATIREWLAELHAGSSERVARGT
jgi:acetyl esterase/lipase